MLGVNQPNKKKEDQMFKKQLNMAVVVFLFLLVSSVTFAQEQKETKFGIGLQILYPVWGISGIMDVTDNISVQGILGPLGDVQIYAVRGIYRFRKEPKWNVYGYGMIGVFRHTYTHTYTYYTDYPYYPYSEIKLETVTETAAGLGVGVGIEYDWRALAPNLPPILWNLEFGLQQVNFKSDYQFPEATFGAGLYYRF